MSELAASTTRGVVWSTAENLSLQAVQFVVSVILARLLLPEQFGIIGMLSLFMAVAQSFLDSGFGSALIQKKEVTTADLSSVFYFNLGIGTVLALTLVLAAPVIAAFYGEAVLAPLTAVLSVNIIISAFGIIPLTLLTRRLDFKLLLWTNLAAVSVSGALGVTAALCGFGIWSLVIQSVFGTFVRTIMLWRTSRWRPSFIFSGESLRAMFPYGSRLLLSGLLDTFTQNLYFLVIGKAYSAVSLGYYVRAQSMQSLAVQPTGSALARVMFPALSPIQDERARLHQVCSKTMKVAVLFHFPLMIGLAVVAIPMISILLGEQWLPSAPYLQLMCVVGLFWPLHVLNLNILKVTGRSDLFFRVEIMKKAFVFLSIAFTFRFGIIALLCGQIVTSFVSYCLNVHYAGQLISYPIGMQTRDVTPYLLMAIVMGTAMYVAGTLFDAQLSQLLAQIITGVVVYFICNLIFGRTIITEVAQLARQVIPLSAAS